MCPLQRKIGELGAEYRQRVEVAAAEARLTAQQQAAAERKQLEALLEEQRRLAAEQVAAAQAAAVAAREEAEEAAALERARHAAELQRLREQHHAELAAVQVLRVAHAMQSHDAFALMLAAPTYCSPPTKWPCSPVFVFVQAQSGAALADREHEHIAMLEELQALRLAMSRASTRQEEQRGSERQEGPLASPLQQRSRLPTAPGQLMELHSDEEDGQCWEQPRAGLPLPLTRHHR